MIKIGITGHRNLLNPDKVKKQIADALKKILVKPNETAFEGYTSLATGADTIFANLAESMANARLEIILPFQQEAYLQTIEKENEKELFLQLINSPKSKVTTLTATIDVTDKTARRQAYFDAGKYIVEHCDVLIAVWDGEEAAGKGGTGDMVALAKEMKKEIILIKAEKRNKDKKYKLADIQALKKDASEKAQKEKKRYDRHLRKALIFLVFAALFLLIPLSIQLPEVVLHVGMCLEVVLSVFAFYYINKVNSNDFKDSRLTPRLEAEALRYMLPLISGGVPLRPMLSVKNENSFAKKIIKIINPAIIEIEKEYAELPLIIKDIEAAKEGIKELLKGQILFHKKRIENTNKIFKKREHTALLLKYLFIGSLAFHIAYLADHYFLHFFCEETLHIIHCAGMFLTLTIPPIYAGFEVYKYFVEYEKFLGESQVYADFLEEMLGKINNDEVDEANLIDFAHNIREVLFSENKIWYSLMKVKELHGIL